MAELITTEIRNNIGSPLDIERFGERFKTENGLFTFPDPNLTVLDKHLYYLLKYSQEIPFDAKYKFRPDYMSYDFYKTVILWPILLYVNGVFSIEDFDLDTVLVPSLDAIINILPDLFPEKSDDELKTIKW